MRKTLVARLMDLFRPKEILDLDVYEILEALGDPIVRKTWLFDVLSEIKGIHMEIDGLLASGRVLDGKTLANLSGRRRAIQFVLESALAAKRDIQRSRGHNPASKGKLDLDSVTLQAGIG